jgi:hypothetical protein
MTLKTIHILSRNCIEANCPNISTYGYKSDKKLNKSTDFQISELINKIRSQAQQLQDHEQ